MTPRLLFPAAALPWAEARGLGLGRGAVGAVLAAYALLFYVDGGTSLAAAGLLCVLPLRLAWAAPSGATTAAPVPGATWLTDSRLVWMLLASFPLRSCSSS